MAPVVAFKENHGEGGGSEHVRYGSLPQDFVWLVAKPRFVYKRTGEKRPVLQLFKYK